MFFTKKEFWQACMVRTIMTQAIKVSLIVGTLLVAINHGDIILSGGELSWWKIILTYLVPYGVATYAAAMQKVSSS